MQFVMFSGDYPLPFIHSKPWLALSFDCLRTVVFISKSQSSWQVTEAELSQIKFETTDSNLETETALVGPIYKGV